MTFDSRGPVRNPRPNVVRPQQPVPQARKEQPRPVVPHSARPVRPLPKETPPLTLADVRDIIDDVLDYVLDAVEVVWPRLSRARVWFGAFRRTRPFWGAMWLVLAGYWVLHFSLGSPILVLSSGVSAMGGWFVSIGMIICGAIACIAPSQRLTAGIIGTLLSIGALVASNFGGFLLGTALGVGGSTMILVWGPKKGLPRARGNRRPVVREAPASSDMAPVFAEVE